MRRVKPITHEDFEQVNADPQIFIKYLQCNAQDLRTVICAVLTQSYVENLSDGEEVL